ncbi:MAG: hypothetical protein D6701_12225 [Gemmatimonadetes bacterium]|nr:MAG: hypothetical protein D6701_12225 [Gemmatimonadota bacterium]
MPAPAPHLHALRRSALALASLCVLFPSAVTAQSVEPEALRSLEPRSIGPAGMSGRIAAITALPDDPDVVYVGAATGGLWKSTNGGQTWRPLFDEQPVLGVGAVAVSPSHPDIVWVGTGEGNPRNSAGVGAGVYRSLDGGETWTFLGLEHSERIHRIVLDPYDPDVAFVGVMGPAWSDGEERGVYRTRDGGRTWDRVLYVDERTGVSDLVMDPRNPRTLFAGMWEFRREPWFFTSGGPGSGLYVSRDGGDTWRRLGPSDGLPEGELGRIGLSVYAADPDIVYALVEARPSVLLRSDDGGRSWRTVNRGGRQVAPRPFYYTDIQVAPDNELRIYNLHSRLQVSEDGGRSFRTIGRGVHSDFHAIWIAPNDPEHLYIGTDGGVFVSRDRGEHFRMIDNLPVGQFYHVSVDDDVPFNIYGGMQDNGSWKGPSDVWENGGIRNYHWKEVAFGDGFGTLVDPLDPAYGYAMSQGGGLVRFDVRTGERKRIRPWAPDSVTLRFNWNAAIATDPFDVGTVYYGSQFVHKSPDRGDSWQIISPDLTTDDPDKQRQQQSGGITRDATGAENHTTILTIAPSPVERDVIWVGTDDGNVQVTTSGGGSWTNVRERIKGVPEGTWVPHIEASKFARGSAFVVFEDHRRGNWEPYIYRTDDYGRNWERIADDDDLRGFVHTVEQDPEAPGLLFAGTEFGLWVTLDGGDHWFPWTYGFPAAPVRSLVVHPRDADLVIGTHGRALWVLDDIRPLRALSLDPTLTRRPVHVFRPPVAYVRRTAQVDGYHFPADAMFSGATRPRGALVSFWAAAPEADSATVEILDETGATLRRWRTGVGAGVNRLVWDLREALPEDARAVGEDPEDLASPGAEVLPGLYTVRVSLDGAESEGVVDVRPDPRVHVSMDDRRARYEAVRRSIVLNARIGALQRTARRVREALDEVGEWLDGSDADPEVVRAVRGGLRELRRALGEAASLTEVQRFRRGLFGMASTYDRPTEGERLDLQRTAEALDRAVERMNTFLAVDYAAFVERVRAAGIDPLPHIPTLPR